MIKVLSLNMHCGKEENYESKMKTIIEQIAFYNPDVVLLQECVQDKGQVVVETKYGIKIRAGNLAKQIVDGLKNQYGCEYDYYFDWGNYAFGNLEEGAAILTKDIIHEAGSQYVSKTMSIDHWWARKIVRASLLINGRECMFYSVHLGWWNDEKEPFKAQIDQLVQWMTSKPDALHFLSGDFNNPSGDEGYQYMIDQLGFRDLYFENNPNGFCDGTFIASGKLSLENENNKLRIDYMLSPDREWKALTVKRVFTGKDAQVVSDHYGLYGEFDL